MRDNIKSSPRGAISKSMLAVLAAILVIAGVAGILVLRRTTSQEGRPVPAPSGETVPSPQASGAPATSSGEVTITIPPEQIANAQIKTEVAEKSEISATD